MHLSRPQGNFCIPCGSFPPVMASVNTSQGVARAADTEEQVISPGRPML